MAKSYLNTYIEEVYNMLEFPKEQVDQIIREFTHVIAWHMQRGDKVMLGSMGLFAPARRFHKWGPNGEKYTLINYDYHMAGSVRKGLRENTVQIEEKK